MKFTKGIDGSFRTATTIQVRLSHKDLARTFVFYRWLDFATAHDVIDNTELSEYVYSEARTVGERRLVADARGAFETNGYVMSENDIEQSGLEALVDRVTGIFELRFPVE